MKSFSGNKVVVIVIVFIETPTAHKIEVDLSCYVKIMAVQFVLALHRSLKKGKQSS